MKHLTDTIREALERAQNGLKWYRDEHPGDASQADDEMNAEIEEALTALSELEAMVGEQEPCGWFESPYGAFRGNPLLNITFPASTLTWQIPAFIATPPAQQPQEPDWKHPKIQALISSDARNRIVIGLIWQILKNPDGDFSAMDMEYWDSIHDAVREAVIDAQQPQAECTRSHPHENMDGYCVLRTEIARLTNENARLQAQQPHEIEVQCPVCSHKFYEWPNDQQPQAEAVHRYVLELPDGDKRKAKVFWNERNEANGEITHHLCISVDAAPQQSQAEDGLSKLRDMLQEAVDRLVAAPQQAEAVPPDVTRDAARYLWLRSKVGVSPEHERAYIWLPCGNSKINPAETDAAIDAAMAQGEKP